MFAFFLFSRAANLELVTAVGVLLLLQEKGVETFEYISLSRKAKINLKLLLSEITSLGELISTKSII